MYRNLYTLLAAVFLSTAIDASAQSFWTRTYGGDGTDVADFIQTTSDGGALVAGQSDSFDPLPYMWILKLNSAGLILWQKTYGTGVSPAHSILPTSDGGSIVATSRIIFQGGISADLWILKLDSSGNTQWQKMYHGDDHDYAYSIQATSDGGYIVAGKTESFGAGDYDFWVLKLDSDGDAMWQKTFGGTDEDIANSVQATSDGGYIVAGTTSSFGAGFADIWILKLEPDGDIEWQKTYGGDSADNAKSILITSDGGYIVAGSTSSSGGGFFYNYWILKLDSSGNIQWQQTYGGAGSDEASSIQITSDAGYIVAGSTVSFGAGSEAWILKLNSLGSIQWQKTYGRSGDDFANSIRQTSNGGYIVAGSSDSFGAGGQEVWVLKLNSNGEIDAECPLYDDTDIVPVASMVSPDGAGLTMDDTDATVSSPVFETSNSAAFSAEQCASFNNPPVAVSDSYSTPIDTPLVIAAPGVLGNDTDADGDKLNTVMQAQPSHGTVDLNPDGSFDYTPDAGFAGVDSFRYAATDGTDESNIVGVTITMGCLFCDDFEDGQLDPGWTYEKPGWTETGGFLSDSAGKKQLQLLPHFSQDARTPRWNCP